MTVNSLRRATALLAVPLLLGLASCASSDSSAGGAGLDSVSPLPPRPTALNLTNVDPCTLLTNAQLEHLGVEHQALTTPETPPDKACVWDNSMASALGKAPDMGYLVRLQLDKGAESAMGSSTGHQLIELDGYTAVQTTSEGNDPQRHCIQVVDVAPGQSLWVQFTNITPEYQGLTHEKSCQFARAFGEDLMQNLRRGAT